LNEEVAELTFEDGRLCPVSQTGGHLKEEGAELFFEDGRLYPVSQKGGQLKEEVAKLLLEDGRLYLCKGDSCKTVDAHVSEQPPYPGKLFNRR
jgi:hypothetical protein